MAHAYRYKGSAPIDKFSKAEQLRNLKMQYLSDDALKRLQKLPNIESIQIESLTSLRIDTLAKAFPRLRELECDKVEAKPLADALPFLESLESLTVRSVPKKDALLYFWFQVRHKPLQNLSRRFSHTFRQTILQSQHANR